MNAVTRRARPVGLLILAVVTACDNVSWGGSDFTVVRPPPPTAALPEDQPAGDDERLPDGPILYYVARTGEGAAMVPVGEVAGDSLRPLRARADPRRFADRFIAEHLRQGSEFVLFRDGVRVGTLVVQSASAPDGDACVALPRATGSLELSPRATTTTEFLALSQLHAPEIPRRIEPRLETTRGMTVVGPILAERMLRRRGAQLPSNWQRAMAQLKPFPTTAGQAPAFASTFLVGDTLGPGLGTGGYSLFFLSVPSPAQVGWDTVFVSFHNYAQDGKAAPRVIDFLDWDRDDEVELLLQVYGEAGSWFEAVGRGADDEWHRILDDRCVPDDASSPAPTGPRIPAPSTRGDTIGSGG